MSDSEFPEPEPERHVITFSKDFSLDTAISTLSAGIGAAAAAKVAVASSQDQVVEIASLDPQSGASVALSFGDAAGAGPTTVAALLDQDQLQGIRQVARAAAPGAIKIEPERQYGTAQEDTTQLEEVAAQLEEMPVQEADGVFGPSLFTNRAGELVYGFAIPPGIVKLVREHVMAGPTAAAAADGESTYTWGLQATRANLSPFDGQGINLAVLDTGFNFQHPDFQGGIDPSDVASFIAGEEPSDANGHGSHTAGTAAGPRTRPTGPGYGVASKARLYIGKVLGNSGTGSTAQILEGIRWALQNNCQVISMSLARRVGLNETGFSAAYEEVAQHALQQGALIVAAAGNFSARPALTWPVCEPANCPSILAVAAVDQFDRTASFSCGGTPTTPAEARVDIAGPGVGVFSSFKAPDLYSILNGTSMATPHVAGIAALYAQVSTNFRGQELWNQLIRTARPLARPVEDVGAGLVQAP